MTATDQLLESESSDAAKAFGPRMLGIVNDAAIGLLLSIGHQTGLFDCMATLAPATSVEIASAAGLNERYVREWLGGMVCAIDRRLRLAIRRPITCRPTMRPR